MEQNPIKNDARKALRRRKLGKSGPCVFCGRETPEAFRQIGYSVGEEHHVAGEANDPTLTVFLCRGCHDAQTELHRILDVHLRHDEIRPWLEIFVDILRAVGSFLINLGEKLVDWAERLLAFIRALDTHFPQWRDLPEAQR